jgi:hypothetical protein
MALLLTAQRILAYELEKSGLGSARALLQRLVIGLRSLSRSTFHQRDMSKLFFSMVMSLLQENLCSVLSVDRVFEVYARRRTRKGEQAR